MPAPSFISQPGVRMVLVNNLYLSWNFFFLTSISLLVRSLRWIKEPSDPTEAREGTDVSLDWDYDLQGVPFRQLIWSDWSDSDADKTIAEWDKSSRPLIFADFQSRFDVDENKKATLVIRNVNQTNNGRYSCDLQGLTNGAVQELSSIIQLLVVSKCCLRIYFCMILLGYRPYSFIWLGRNKKENNYPCENNPIIFLLNSYFNAVIPISMLFYYWTFRFYPYHACFGK